MYAQEGGVKQTKKVIKQTKKVIKQTKKGIKQKKWLVLKGAAWRGAARRAGFQKFFDHDPDPPGMW